MTPPFRNYGAVALVLTVAAFAALRGFVGLGVYVTALLALSLATFALYGWDKLQAKARGDRAKLRVPEILLHLLALLGGFAGGWAGMVIFWHKVRKPVFWAVLAVSTLLHGLLLFSMG